MDFWALYAPHAQLSAFSYIHECSTIHPHRLWRRKYNPEDCSYTANKNVNKSSISKYQLILSQLVKCWPFNFELKTGKFIPQVNFWIVKVGTQSFRMHFIYLPMFCKACSVTHWKLWK